jgi:Na+-translocating ferredoxin:NAD+ oxidoreductase RnfC subunit
MSSHRVCSEHAIVACSAYTPHSRLYAPQARELLELRREARILAEEKEELASDLRVCKAQVRALEGAHQQDRKRARAAQQAAATASATTSAAAAAAAAADAAGQLALLAADLGTAKQLLANSKVRGNTAYMGAVGNACTKVASLSRDVLLMPFSVAKCRPHHRWRLPFQSCQ